MFSRKNKAILSAAVTLAFLAVNYFSSTKASTHTTQTAQTSYKTSKSLSSVSQAYAQKRSDVQVSGSGTVVKVLADDTKGHKHQKFILRVDGKTILIAHNIDLAPRLNGLKRGDRVEFNGEYEYNERGGVVHWTHHAPRGRHADGWLKYRGKVFK
jgi:hypothetical protein